LCAGNIHIRTPCSAPVRSYACLQLTFVLLHVALLCKASNTHICVPACYAVQGIKYTHTHFVAAYYAVQGITHTHTHTYTLALCCCMLRCARHQTHTHIFLLHATLCKASHTQTHTYTHTLCCCMLRCARCSILASHTHTNTVGCC